MSDWTAGYVADIGYTYGYYTELNPLRLQLAFINAGLKAPSVGYACELGFGQGLSVNVHAAASDAVWYGNDFNPAQAVFAQELADASGSNASLSDESFVEFCSRTDLPDFDFIALHGIWSWISQENQAVIVEFIRRKLKVGGVLYISYNTLPGLAAALPLRHLLTEHAESMAAPGSGLVSRIDAAIGFAEALFATDPVYGRANPQIIERIKFMKAQNRSYLAHEYFNRDWHPMRFSELAGRLSSAKLTYACSAHYLSHLDEVNLTQSQQEFLKQIPDGTFRETVRDFMTNQQFRKDYWVKGASRIPVLDRLEAARCVRVLLVSHLADIRLKVKGAAGEAELSKDVYGAILDALSDHQIKTLGQVEQSVAKRGLTFGHVLEAALVLTEIGAITAVQDESVIQRAKPKTDKLNKHLMLKARSSDDISGLASPVSGGAIAVSRIAQLFLLSRMEGKTTLEDWAKYAWHFLSIHGQSIVKDGKALDTPQENLTELLLQASVFAEKQLPILKALKIA